MSNSKTLSEQIAELGEKLYNRVPFPDGHKRHAMRDYETYRDRALKFLRGQDVREYYAQRIVDDVIGVAENLNNRNRSLVSLDA
jgi:hypothetical protein